MKLSFKDFLLEVYRLTPARRNLLKKIETGAEADYQDYIDRTTDLSDPLGVMPVDHETPELIRQRENAEGKLDRVKLIRQLAIPRDKRNPGYNERSLFISKPKKAQDKKLKGALKSARILQRYGDEHPQTGERSVGY
jgi:hypothetical protein